MIEQILYAIESVNYWDEPPGEFCGLCPDKVFLENVVPLWTYDIMKDCINEMREHDILDYLEHQDLPEKDSQEKFLLSMEKYKSKNRYKLPKLPPPIQEVKQLIYHSGTNIFVIKEFTGHYIDAVYIVPNDANLNRNFYEFHPFAKSY